MSLRRVVAVLGLAAGLALAGDAGAGPPRREQTWWIGADGVPLAVSSRASVRPAPANACVRWGTRGSKWRAIDAWGQEIGRARVSTGATMDTALDACFYPSLEVVSGVGGVLYASDRGAFRAPASVRWAPSDDERRAFERFAGQVGALAGARIEGSAGVFFFRVPAASDLGREEGRFAVAGGAALVIARWSAGGRWTLKHLERGAAKVRPRAVFDMNDDGAPEILYEWESLDDTGRNVLEIDPSRVGWRTAAESAYGTTA